MEQTESQLEIFRIILGRKTIRQIIEEKNSIESGTFDDTNLFQRLFSDLLSKLTQNMAWTSERTKWGLALFSNAGENVNDILTCHSRLCCIEGFIDGGPYNKIKTIAQTTDVSQREQLGRDKMVAERFYTYLHLPLSSKTGILLIERKGSASISTIIQMLITELLKTSRSAVKFERFVPNELVEEYKEGGIVDTFTFTDSITTSAMDREGEGQIEKKYGVTIKITPPEGDKPDYASLNGILSIIGEGSMKLGTTIKHLSEFTNKKGSLKKEQKKYSFSIGDDLKIRPMIAVNDELQDEETGTLKRVDIKEMCDNILEQIREDVYIIQ